MLFVFRHCKDWAFMWGHKNGDLPQIIICSKSTFYENKGDLRRGFLGDKSIFGGFHLKFCVYPTVLVWCLGTCLIGSLWVFHVSNNHIINEHIR